MATYHKTCEREGCGLAFVAKSHKAKWCSRRCKCLIYCETNREAVAARIKRQRARRRLTAALKREYEARQAIERIRAVMGVPLMRCVLCTTSYTPTNNLAGQLCNDCRREIQDAVLVRKCADCPADISDRPCRAILCKKCASARNAKRTRELRRDPTYRALERGQRIRRHKERLRSDPLYADDLRRKARERMRKLAADPVWAAEKRVYERARSPIRKTSKRNRAREVAALKREFEARQAIEQITPLLEPRN